MNKHKRQRRTFHRLFLILSGLSAVLIAFLFTRQWSDWKGTPNIQVDRERIDFGVVRNNTPLTFAIKVTNTGDGTLRFTEPPSIEILQGCCPPRLTIGALALRPGQSTVIRSGVFMMHEGMDGPHDYAVHLKTNDPDTPDLVVHVLSIWTP